jgi:hypothetical protein
MEYKVVTSSSANGLNESVQKLIWEGFKPVGGHHVVEVHHQLRFSGMQHKDTQIEREYSQTMIKESK